MEIICPDTATFFHWRDVMTQTGIGLLVALALFAVVIWAARPSGWPLRLAAGVCVALALGVVIASFVIHAQLDAAAKRVALWFPYYPQSCDPVSTFGGIPNLPESVRQIAVRILAPAEQAAAVDLALAVASALALWYVVYTLVRAARLRDMTPVMVES